MNLWLATPEEDSMFYRPAASAMNVLLGQNAAAFDNVTYLLDRRIEGATRMARAAAGLPADPAAAGAPGGGAEGVVRALLLVLVMVGVQQVGLALLRPQDSHRLQHSGVGVRM